MTDIHLDLKIVKDAFPQIGEKLERHWGSKEFISYMHELLHDSRDGARKGFPNEVLLALHRLSIENEQALWQDTWTQIKR